MAPKLAIQHLGKTFGDLQALSDIDLAVERGEFISVVGPSGCGKTTLLRMIAGLEEITGGEILIVQYPGPSTGERPIYDGRFNKAERIEVAKERVDL